jgi:hypothetical protein
MVPAGISPIVVRNASISSILRDRNASGADLALLPEQRMKNAQEKYTRKSCREE